MESTILFNLWNKSCHKQAFSGWCAVRAFILSKESITNLSGCAIHRQQSGLTFERDGDIKQEYYQGTI